MAQTAWFSFNSTFDVPIDASVWVQGYEKAAVWRLARDLFRPAYKTVYGLRQRCDTANGLRFDRLKGVYVIAYRRRPIYVGRAGGSETLASRLGKHRIKLTGSNWGVGVYHPFRWQAFVKNRYAREPALLQNDGLADFMFTTFPMAAPTLSQLEQLESSVYADLADAEGAANLLNDPGKVAPLRTRHTSIVLP